MAVLVEVEVTAFRMKFFVSDNPYRAAQGVLDERQLAMPT